MDRSVPAFIKNYELGFAGKSKQYGLKSIATLISGENKIVRGYCTLHTDREVSILNTFNGYPLTYDLIKIQAY
jgi:hypothetical protein